MTDGTATEANYGVEDPDLEVGDEGPEFVVEDLERRDFVKYAGASGDFNPIHYDEPFATGAGNPSVFAQGMLTAGIASTMLAEWLGVGNVTQFGTRFVAQVWPEDSVTATATVTDKETTDGTVTYSFDLAVTNQNDEDVVTGSATAEFET